MCFGVISSQGQVLPVEPAGVQSKSSPSSYPQVKSTSEFIQFIHPPIYLTQNTLVTVEYKCTETSIVGLDVRISTPLQEQAQIFIKTWKCEPNKNIHRRIKVTLPNNLGYKPSWNNRNAVTVKKNKASLRAWVIDAETWEKVKTQKAGYVHGRVKASQKMQFPSPYDRPDKPVSTCLSWWLELQQRGPYSPQCQIEPEVYKAVTFPVALNGGSYGVIRVLPNFHNKILQMQRKTSMRSPRFTIVVWVYIIEYCPAKHTDLCSIMQRMTWDDLYMSPLVFITSKGHVHVQTVTETGVSHAFVAYTPVPKNQWVRLTLSYNTRTWSVVYQWGPSWKENVTSTYAVPQEFVPYYDDTQELTVFGGSELTPSFKGYIGEATIYRMKNFNYKNIPFPSSLHPMFELGLSEKERKCQGYLSWVRYRIYQAKELRKYLIEKRSCPNSWRATFGVEPPSAPISEDTQCSLLGGYRQKKYTFVNDLVKGWILNGVNFELEDLGNALYVNATDILESQGLASVPDMIPVLKQASCYGNHDANFMLATIYSNGIGVKPQELLAHSYLMFGALEGNRLCLLALGNKHVYGLDKMPLDHEQAYVYYKNVADRTRQDREDHVESDIYTEKIRLTDEHSVEAQTDEEGDLFLWFKHQAQQGVVHAQRDMARLLFWGQQGIKRNLALAAEYYRMGAESGDSQAMYDYGIVLLKERKGQGIEKNETEAIIQLTKSADMGNDAALNTLGWIALEMDHNRTKAADFFDRSYRHGNPDAAHNIGHMLMSGTYRDKGVDRETAFDYFSFAAKKGQLDSGIQIAMYNMRGHPKAIRNAAFGNDWARFLAEQNPGVGLFLSKGLRAYRDQNWPAALFYYILAANTGVEVGNFNLAYLCEENMGDLTSYVAKECVWHYYNLTIQREHQYVNSYSWLKMGDYYWYGCEHTRDARKAAEMYANAAYAGDPHALFNLAYLVEEGVWVPYHIWRKLRIPRAATASNVTLLMEIYSKCKESHNTEAYLPCTISLLRIQAMDLWDRYNIFVKLSSALGLLAAITLTGTFVYSHVRRNRIGVNTV